MRSWSILLALSVLVAAPSAGADDSDQAAKDVARRYAEEGIAFHEGGNEAAAVESFTRAFQALAIPTIGIRLARSLVKVGRLVEAKKVYQVVVATRVKKDDPSVFNQAVTDAGAELKELEPRIPTLELTIAAGVSSPTLDGSAVSPDTLGKPVPLDPGAHRISGLGAVPQAPVLREREHLVLTLKAPIASTPPPPPGAPVDWRRIAGISGLGLAGASLVVAVVGSLQARSVGTDPAFLSYASTSTADDVCVSATFGGDQPNAAITALCAKGHGAELRQAIFYPAFVVLGGVGTYLLLTSGKPSSRPAARTRFSPYIGPRTAGIDVIGTF